MADEISKLGSVIKDISSSPNIKNLNSFLSDFGKDIKDKFKTINEDKTSEVESSEVSSKKDKSKSNTAEKVSQRYTLPKIATPNLGANDSQSDILQAIYKLLSNKIRYDQIKDEREKSETASKIKDYEFDYDTSKESGKSIDNLDDFLKNPFKGIKDSAKDIIEVFGSFKNILTKFIPSLVKIISNIMKFIPLLSGALVELGPILLGIGAVGVGLKKAFDVESAPSLKDTGQYAVDSEGNKRSGKQVGEMGKSGSGTIRRWDDLGKDTTEIQTSVDEGTKTLLSRITKGEGTDDAKARKAGFESGYDVPYGFGKYVKPDKPLSQMTVGEVKEFQKKQIAATSGKVPGTKLGTGAVGKYQVVQGTLSAQQKLLGFSDEDIFTPELQDKIGRSLLEGRGYKKYREGKISEEQFQKNLSKEWASIADPTTGRSAYGQSTGTSDSAIKEAIRYSKEHREDQKKIELAENQKEESNKIEGAVPVKSGGTELGTGIVVPYKESNKTEGAVPVKSGGTELGTGIVVPYKESKLPKEDQKMMITSSKKIMPEDIEEEEEQEETSEKLIKEPTTNKEIYRDSITPVSETKDSTTQAESSSNFDNTIGLLENIASDIGAIQSKKTEADKSASTMKDSISSMFGVTPMQPELITKNPLSNITDSISSMFGGNSSGGLETVGKVGSMIPGIARSLGGLFGGNSRGRNSSGQLGGILQTVGKVGSMIPTISKTLGGLFGGLFEEPSDNKNTNVEGNISTTSDGSIKGNPSSKVGDFSTGNIGGNFDISSIGKSSSLLDVVSNVKDIANLQGMKSGERLPSLQAQNTSNLGELGVTTFNGGSSVTPISSGGGGGNSGGSSAPILSSSGGGGSSKNGDRRAGSSSTAMGINIGVRNEESVFQKAQYGIVRIV
jgi:hypothetical protein